MENEIKKYFSGSSRHVEAGDILPGNNKQDFSLHSKGQNQNHPTNRPTDYPPTTIYFGGGTPSILSLEEVKSILDCFPFFQKSNHPTFQPSTNEVSFECNPEDITSEYVGGLFNLGVNRLSLGVQSLNDDTLKAIHRSNRESIFRALEYIETQTDAQTQRNVSIFPKTKKQETSVSSVCVSVSHSPSVNVDFILGLPFSKPGETLTHIRELHEKFTFITHTSVYMLEDGLYPKEWKKNSITEREIEQEYSDICQYFDSLGWHHYEISNWAKSGYECKHNLGYWNHTNYRGFGLSATSFSLPPFEEPVPDLIREGIQGDSIESVREEGGNIARRSTNASSFIGYYKGSMSEDESLTKKELDLEKIIFGIRTFSLERSGFDESIIRNLEKKGWIEKESTKIVLTPAGIFRENTIISSLIEN